MEQVSRTTGQPVSELVEQPPRVEEFNYLWLWYLDARSGEALTFTELRNWSELTGRSLVPWEVDVLRALDRIFWRVMRG